MKDKKIPLSVLLYIALVSSFILPASAIAQEQVMPMVAKGDDHTVGLRVDGTVVAVGDNSHGQCNVGNWKDIVQVAADGDHTVGLKADGTVVAVGWNKWGQCDVDNWTDIVQVAAGGSNTFGLKADGTVVATGCNIPGQCDVSDWTHIVQVATGYYSGYAVGLRTNGTVVAANFMVDSQLAKWNLLLPVPLTNWPLIGGIIAAVIVVGLAIFLARRKRRG